MEHTRPLEDTLKPDVSNNGCLTRHERAINQALERKKEKNNNHTNHRTRCYSQDL